MKNEKHINIFNDEGDLMTNGLTVRKDGRLTTSITDPKTKKRIYFYGKSKSELKMKIFEYQTKEKRGRDFTDVSDEWWEEAEPGLALQSRRGYLCSKKKADVEFCGVSIKDITARDIKLYLNRLSKTYDSQKTVEKYRLVINLIFKYAVEHGDIEHNPCADIKIPKGLKKARREAASPRDERIIKETLEGWLLPFFAIYTGMRKGEILALRWQDIDFEKDMIYVHSSVAHNGDRPLLKDTKTEAGNRLVPLLRPLKERLLKIENRKQTDFIFSDDGKKPLTNKRYITLFKQYREQTGVSCTAHQLRHSFATIAFENDISPKAVQEILGHKQLSTTMDIYTDFRQSHLQKLTEELNSKIK